MLGLETSNQLTSGVSVYKRLSGLDHLVESPCFKDETVTAPPADIQGSFGALHLGLGPGATHLGRADLGDVT